MKNYNEKVEVMREGGKKIGTILLELLDFTAPGVSLLDIETLAQQKIRASGGTPSFQTVQGYKWATCLNVNDGIVHGIPNQYILKEGDSINIDIGLLYKGFHTDTGWTKIVHGNEFSVDSKIQKFLDTGEVALWKAIDQAVIGNRIGHISQTIQKIVEASGYGVVKTLVGHGISRELHEAPQIPGFLRGSVEKTLPLTEGMTIAIEVIYTMGNPTVRYANKDGWSIATTDGSRAAVFEHTIAITPSGPIILTKVNK
jgi:methionyl aminopeptidase